MSKKSINNFKKTNYWKNLLKNRNSISPLIAISLLIVVVIIAVIGYQGWYENYSSNIMVHTETESNTALDNTLIVEDLIGSNLYILNDVGNTTISKIRIGGNDCALNYSLEMGAQSIDVSECLVGLNTKTQSVVLYTDNIVIDKTVFIDSVSVVANSPASISSFSSNDSFIDYGNSINLTWSSSDSNNCTASGDWSGLKSVSSSVIVSSIEENKTFYLFCDGIYGNSSISVVTVVVGVPNNCLGPGPIVINHDDSHVYYLYNEVAYNESCVNETRTCNNGNLSGTYQNTSCTNLFCPINTFISSCKECDGSGGEQMPVDDTVCGTIDCDGLDNYWEDGADSATGTNYCKYDNYADLTSLRCELLGDCKDANTADCGSASTSTQATAGVCEYIAGCTGSTIGTVSDYSSGTDTGLCRECDGSGSEQADSDDSGCGTIDCDGLNYYFTDGSASATGTNYCKLRDYIDLTTNRCEGLSDCKDPNSGDCTSYGDSTSDTCGVCEYATGACSSCSNYGSGTDSGTCRECDGSGGEQMPTDDTACGTIDCDGLNSYYQDGSDSASGTNYCKYRNYADLTSSRCEGIGNCKDANTGDCTSYADSTQATAGLCRYISGCSGGTSGTVSTYSNGVACGNDGTCNSGNCCSPDMGDSCRYSTVSCNYDYDNFGGITTYAACQTKCESEGFPYIHSYCSSFDSSDICDDYCRCSISCPNYILGTIGCDGLCS